MGMSTPDTVAALFAALIFATFFFSLPKLWEWLIAFVERLIRTAQDMGRMVKVIAKL